MEIDYFDLHCDTLTEIYRRKTDFDDVSLAVSVKSTDGFSRFVQNFAVWIDDRAENAQELYSSTLQYGKIALKKGGFAVLNNECKTQKCARKIGLLSLEGGRPIDSLEFVDRLAADGIKTVSLTWNYRNQLVSGVLSEGGLTRFGVEVINQLNKNKMRLDLSHLNSEGFYEAIEIADTVLVTHTGVFDLVPHKRNLTIEQLRLVGQKNGLIGLCFYPEFIGDDVFDGIYKAVSLLLEKGLQDNIALGSDFDGAEMSKVLQKSADVRPLYEFLLHKGLSSEVLDQIFYKNAYKYYGMF